LSNTTYKQTQLHHKRRYHYLSITVNYDSLTKANVPRPISSFPLTGRFAAGRKLYCLSNHTVHTQSLTHTHTHNTIATLVQGWLMPVACPPARLRATVRADKFSGRPTDRHRASGQAGAQNRLAVQRPHLYRLLTAQREQSTSLARSEALDGITART
jgi:hypothetical protein